MYVFGFHRADVTTYERSHVMKNASSAYLQTYIETIILPEWNYIAPFLKHNLRFIIPSVNEVAERGYSNGTFRPSFRPSVLPSVIN